MPVLDDKDTGVVDRARSTGVSGVGVTARGDGGVETVVGAFVVGVIFMCLFAEEEEEESGLAVADMSATPRAGSCVLQDTAKLSFSDDVVVLSMVLVIDVFF